MENKRISNYMHRVGKGHLLLCFLQLFFCTLLHAQNSISVTQYFNLMPAFAPALNGANDFLDIRAGTRHQWSGYEGAPRTHLISANGSVSVGDINSNKYNSLRVDNMNPYKKRGVKIGIGGYVFDDRAGGFRQLEALAGAAVHVPMNSSTYLSLGLSSGIYHGNIDLSDVFVLDPTNDKTFQDFKENGIGGNQFKMAAGLALYSDRYYVNYSIIGTGSETRLERFSTSGFSSSNIHILLGGLIFDAGPFMEIIPNAFVRFGNSLSAVYDVGLRARYHKNPYVGITYRNTGSLITMLGFTYEDKINIGYSLETFSNNSVSTSSFSHEIILGFRAFNFGKFVPMW